MKLSDLSIKRPVLAVVMSLLLAGGFAAVQAALQAGSPAEAQAWLALRDLLGPHGHRHSRARRGQRVGHHNHPRVTGDAARRRDRAFPDIHMSEKPGHRAAERTVVERLRRIGLSLPLLQQLALDLDDDAPLLRVTEVQRGLFPMAGSAVRLRRQIGYAVEARDGDVLTVALPSWRTQARAPGSARRRRLLASMMISTGAWSAGSSATSWRPTVRPIGVFFAFMR